MTHAEHYWRDARATVVLLSKRSVWLGCGESILLLRLHWRGGRGWCKGRMRRIPSPQLWRGLRLELASLNLTPMGQRPRPTDFWVPVRLGL